MYSKLGKVGVQYSSVPGWEGAGRYWGTGGEAGLRVQGGAGHRGASLPPQVRHLGIMVT